MSSSTRLYTPAQQQKAARLMAVADKWAEGYRVRDGLRFVSFTSDRAPKPGQPPVIYYTRLDGRGGCTCPAARLSRSGRCFHKLAAAIVFDQRQEAAFSPPISEESAYDLCDAF